MCNLHDLTQYACALRKSIAKRCEETPRLLIDINVSGISLWIVPLTV